MNIEHLKEAANEAADKYLRKEYDLFDCEEWNRSDFIGGFMEGIEYSLANPRTPIDADKMVENYREMYEMLEEIEQNCTGFKYYPLATKIKSVLEKSKLPQ